MIDFYSNQVVIEAGTISTVVKGDLIVVDAAKLGHILHILAAGYSNYDIDSHFLSTLIYKYSQGLILLLLRSFLKVL